jgi:hypothetical protein
MPFTAFNDKICRSGWEIIGKCYKNTKLTRNDFDASPPITMLVCFLLQQLREMSRRILPLNRSARFSPFLVSILLYNAFKTFAKYSWQSGLWFFAITFQSLRMNREKSTDFEKFSGPCAVEIWQLSLNHTLPRPPRWHLIRATRFLGR